MGQYKNKMKKRKKSIPKRFYYFNLNGLNSGFRASEIKKLKFKDLKNGN